VSSAVGAAPQTLDVCINFHCRAQRAVALGEAQWQELVALFAPAASAAQERQSIAMAIARMEQMVGVQAGTSGDLPRNNGDGGRIGQLDCIAESRNATTYLHALQDAGLLRWHSVAAPAKRQRWVFSIHHTAVIEETATHRQFAVDSWYQGNGVAPLVQPLDDWRRARNEPAR